MRSQVVEEFGGRHGGVYTWVVKNSNNVIVAIYRVKWHTC